MHSLFDSICICFVTKAVAIEAKLLVMQIQIFSVYRPYNESIFREMNNDNDLNLHNITKLLGWLRYCTKV